MDYKYNCTLLLDDSDLDNFIAETTLKTNFFSRKVYIKKDVASALEFLYSFQETSEDFPQVFFIDINLPAADGFEFLTEIKNNPPPCVIKRRPKLVVLTTSPHQADEQRMREIFRDIIYLVKPLTNEKLNFI